MLAVFLANPEKFVDYAGQATEFAVREFARAGIQLASAAGLGACAGWRSSISQTLAAYGLDSTRPPLDRYGPRRTRCLLRALILLGLPVRWMLRPFALVVPADRISLRVGWRLVVTSQSRQIRRRLTHPFGPGSNHELKT